MPRHFFFIFGFLVLGILLCTPHAWAQRAWIAELLPTAPIDQNLPVFQVHTDSASMAAYGWAVRDSLTKRGYWQANIDTSWQVGDTLKSRLFVGELMSSFKLSAGNIPPKWLSGTSFRDLKKPLVLNPQQFQGILSEIAETGADYGYPLGKVHLREIETDSTQLTATLHLERGKLVRFKPIVIETAGLRLRPNYLQHYLGILPDQPYQNKRIQRARQRLKALPFLKETQAPTVLFNNQEAEVHLFLEPQNASRFDFIIGVLPNSTSNPGAIAERRTLVTGVLTAELHNQFGRGERIFINAERLRPQTARIDGNFAYPYLLDLPFGVEGGFHFYRRDTSFLNAKGQFGIQYLLPGGNYLKLFWENSSSRIISFDSDRLISRKELPTNLDLSTNSFGLEYNWQNYDYRWNPRQGWGFLLRGSVGFRSIQPNNRILELMDPLAPEFSFASLYDSLDQQQNQYQFEVEANRFLSVGASSTALLRVVGGGLLGTETLYLNEQYRLGGSRRLRGFDEESVFASQYLINTLEYRLLTGKNAYFFGFGDFGIVNNERIDLNVREYPLGFGAGITFATSAGQFAVSYAYGTQWSESVDFSAAKIHFGYLSLF